MKVSWNIILIVAMICFIVMIVSMGVRMATSSSELYERDYYEKGEDHAQRMEKESVSEEVTISYDSSSQMLNIDFGIEEGSISSIRGLKLSNSAQDFKFKPDQKQFRTAAYPLELSQGIWVLEVKGERKGEAFFKKLNVTI